MSYCPIVRVKQATQSFTPNRTWAAPPALALIHALVHFIGDPSYSSTEAPLSSSMRGAQDTWHLISRSVISPNSRSLSPNSTLVWNRLKRHSPTAAAG